MDGGPERARIAAEQLLPEPVADHRDSILARQVLARREDPADFGVVSGQAEEIGGGLRQFCPHRLGRASHIQFVLAVQGRVFQVAAVRAPIVKSAGIIRRRECEAELHDALGRAEGQRAQQ